MNQNVEIPFLMISSRVLKDVRLNDSSKVLFCHLINYINNDVGAFYASNSYLAEICNCKETSIKYRLNLLEKCGYIKRITKKNGMLWDRKIYPILDVPNQASYENCVFSFNFIVDKVFKSLTASEQSILCVILRNTLGNKKQNCTLSLADLTSITGLTKNTVIKSVKLLLNKKIITKKCEGVFGQQITFYSLNVDYFFNDLQNHKS